MRVSELSLPILTTLFRMGPLPERKLWLKSGTTAVTTWKKNALQPVLKAGLVKLNEQTQVYELEDLGKKVLLRKLNVKETDLASETAFAADYQLRPMETTLKTGCMSQVGAIR